MIAAVRQTSNPEIAGRDPQREAEMNKTTNMASEPCLFGSHVCLFHILRAMWSKY